LHQRIEFEWQEITTEDNNVGACRECPAGLIPVKKRVGGLTKANPHQFSLMSTTEITSTNLSRPITCRGIADPPENEMPNMFLASESCKPVCSPKLISPQKTIPQNGKLLSGNGIFFRAM
jgi:hypothetical protein